MVSSAGTPPLVGTAARRRRALAHLSPIFDLHLYRARNPSDVDRSAYDFIALVQLTVDTIALSSGLDGNLGAPREFVLIEMTRTAAAMAPQRPADEHAHVAAHVTSWHGGPPTSGCRPTQRQLLVAVNEWLRRTDGGNVPVVAAAERAYELLGDEKAFDSWPPRGGCDPMGTGPVDVRVTKANVSKWTVQAVMYRRFGSRKKP